MPAPAHDDIARRDPDPRQKPEGAPLNRQKTRADTADEIDSRVAAKSDLARRLECRATAPRRRAGFPTAGVCKAARDREKTLLSGRSPVPGRRTSPSRDRKLPTPHPDRVTVMY